MQRTVADKNGGISVPLNEKEIRDIELDSESEFLKKEKQDLEDKDKSSKKKKAMSKLEKLGLSEDDLKALFA